MMKLDEITYKIIGCAMKVHSTLGNGFQEVIYQRCLAIELENAELGFEREKEQAIYYNDINVGSRRADFVVEDKVVVELKALINLEDIHLAQAKNYVIAYSLPVGLLINLGPLASNTRRCLTVSIIDINPSVPLMLRESCPSINPENPDSDKLSEISSNPPH